MTTANNGRDNGIGWAVKQMRDGRLVARRGWNGKGMWLYLVADPDPMLEASTMPYVVMNTADGGKVPWLCSQTDLLANDWEVVS